MTDIFELQANWLKTWQEGQDRFIKQCAEFGEVYAGAESLKGWFDSQGDMQGQFTDFSRRLNETISSAWSGKVPSEMLNFMNTSSIEGLSKSWHAVADFWGGANKSLGVDRGWQQTADYLCSLLGTEKSFFSPLGFTTQMSRLFDIMQGVWGQEESAISDVMSGYQDFFAEVFESTRSQALEKVVEMFEAWAKETENHLSAPKLGIHRELVHDISQLLVLSQEYLQAYLKMARLMESTARKATLRFQTKLSESALHNKPVNKFIDLCALWSVENESIFIQVMGSDDFAKLQGDLLNAGHRLKMQWDKLAERALEPTPIALKRDLDLAIAEITQLKREMRSLQRELRERGKEPSVPPEPHPAPKKRATRRKTA